MKLRYVTYFLLFIFCHRAESVCHHKLSLHEAITETLGYQWNIFISEMQIQNRAGIYQSSKAPFDPKFQVKAKQGWGDTWSRQLGIELGDDDIFEGVPGVGTIKSRSPGGLQVNILDTNVSGSLVKRTRFGTALSVEASVDRVKNPFFLLNDIYSIDQFNYIRKATANVVVRINQPLLKGFLNSIDTTTERAKQYQLESARYSLVNEMAEQVLETVDAYWDLVKAHKLVKANTVAMNEHQKIVDDVKELIDKNQVAKTQISQASRDLLNAKSNVEKSKQQVVESAQRLSYSMGAPEEYMRYCRMNIKLDDFPIRDIHEMLSCNKTVKPATQFAVAHRADLVSLEYQKKAAAVQVKGTFNETLPTLNLELGGRKTNVAYGKDAKSVFEAFSMPAPERELSVGLSLVFPIFRDYGRGQYKSAKAVKRQMDLRYERLRSKIVSNVIDGINNHNSLIKQLLDTSNSLCEAEVYLEQQKVLFKAGFTDLFELLDSVNKTVFQKVRKIEVEAAYFQNIAKIHYLLGLLVTTGKDGKQFEVQDVVTLPEEIWMKIVGVDNE
ncbi:MAG: hypothetical protein S4CHLAM37_07730 [Chlamydiia bacterium]|nr:hypothetical protein [Chlamydiia bacterium]